MRRWNGWGEARRETPLPAAARAFLAQRLGEGEVGGDASLASACARVPASRLPARPGWERDAESRLRHAHGQSFADWAALRHGAVGRFRDAVARPRDHAETRAVLAAAERAGAVVIPYGGGTAWSGICRWSTTAGR